jgi:hypothetical protein
LETSVGKIKLLSNIKLKELKMEKGKNNELGKNKIKLDETIKMLFSVSKPLVINIVNYFFNEYFNANDDDYDVEFTATESVDLKIELKRADLFVKVGKMNTYHFEFQLNGEKYMVLRMFDYGYRKALSEQKDENIICFPKQAVLYLEEGKGVPDELKLKLIFPLTDKGEQEVLYRVIVKKAWEISEEEKFKRGLYSLLPLEIFKLRKKAGAIKTASEDEFFQLSKQIKNDTMKIIDKAIELFDEKKLTEGDYEKITQAVVYLIEYFSENYADLKLSKEVSDVSEYIHTRGKIEGIREGKVEGIREGKEEAFMQLTKNMLKDGLSIERVSNITKLPIETIIKIKKEIEQNSN